MTVLSQKFPTTKFEITI